MSVFALSVREQRRSPQPHGEAAHLNRDDLRRVLIALGVALAFSSALVFSLLELPFAPQSTPSTAPNLAKPAWIDIPRPFRLFALNSPEWGRAPASYTAERHRDGGGRRDHLTFGAFGADRPWLHLTLYRAGSEDADPRPFFVDIARRAAPSGLAVARMSLPKALPTRFGTFDVAEFTLAGASGASGPSTRCLGFRLADGQVLQIGGFTCGPPGAPIERSRLACTLERIDLVSAGDDKQLRGFFTGAPSGPGVACRGAEPVPGGAGESAKAGKGFVVLR
jgi:hypothetical protein